MQIKRKEQRNYLDIKTVKIRCTICIKNNIAKLRKTT